MISNDSGDHLVFIWWNTSLAPPVPNGRNSRTDTDRDFVVRHIRELYKTYKFAILGCCEVSDEDLIYIEKGLSDLNLTIADTIGRDGRLILDTAIIYDPAVLTRKDFKHLTDRYGTDSLKAGTQHSFAMKSEALEFDVVTSHWPGRKSSPEWAPKRGKLGQYLCNEMRKVKELKGKDAYIVLMGDYNDDPFSISLSSYLMATRDREMAKSDSAFFYNPFWRHLGESSHLDSDPHNLGICGTHYYHGGEYSRWYTLDQIIFSSNFLDGNGKAVLAEEYSQILVTTELRDALFSRTSVFDHFPIISAVKVR